LHADIVEDRLSEGFGMFHRRTDQTERPVVGPEAEEQPEVRAAAGACAGSKESKHIAKRQVVLGEKVARADRRSCKGNVL